MYFSFMENLIYKNNCGNIPNEMAKIFKLLKKTFLKLTIEEKGYFLKENILYLKQSIANKQNITNIND